MARPPHLLGTSLLVGLLCGMGPALVGAVVALQALGELFWMLPILVGVPAVATLLGAVAAAFLLATPTAAPHPFVAWTGQGALAFLTTVLVFEPMLGPKTVPWVALSALLGAVPVALVAMRARLVSLS